MPLLLSEPIPPPTSSHAAAERKALAAFHRYIQLAACGASADDLIAAQAALDACLEGSGILEEELFGLYPEYRVFALIGALLDRTTV